MTVTSLEEKPERSEERINALPWIASVALLAAVAALVAAVIALAKDDGGSSASGGSGMAMSMGSEGMAHMAPLPMTGIQNAPADTGATELQGVERNGVIEYTLDARPVWWQITKTQRLAAYAYNGIVPGPTIRVRNGQRVRLRFTNNLPEPTTVHWHGVDVPNAMDGVPDVTQKAIEPGKSFTYEFTARPAGDPNGSGTFLYHSHVDEDRQMPVGLYGALIIDPASGPSRVPERTLTFSEWTADAASGRTRGVMQMEGMLPNFFTINGKSYPDTAPIDVKAGQLVRFRLVNAGQLAHPIHLHGTSFRIVARDGHATTERGLRDTVTLESGERADIEFRLPKGKWILHCHIGHHLTNDGEGPGGLIQLINAT